MSSKNPTSDKDKSAEIVAQARRNRQQREQGYRDQALKLFPWICARCGRDFEANRLRELTVHHKDHNHGNNPPDGSNWELLCIYCHDNEHSRYENAQWFAKTTPGGNQETRSTYRPFGDLEALLKDEN